MAVVYPQAGNIGGGGFLVGYTKMEKIALDYRETAPKNVSRDMYFDEKEKPILIYHKTEDWLSVFLVRFLGCFTRIKIGKLPMSVLIQPAIDLAQKRFADRKRSEFT